MAWGVKQIATKRSKNRKRKHFRGELSIMMSWMFVSTEEDKEISNISCAKGANREPLSDIPSMRDSTSIA